MSETSVERWWQKEGIVFAANWEPLMFRRRIGSAATDEAERYEYEHSPETVDDLAEAGVNLLITHFHKGFGFEVEQEEIQKAKELADRCHEQGIRIGYYIRPDTLVSETFFEEQPSSEDWLQVNQYGEHPTYGAHQTFRVKPCINKESYMEYLENVVRYAVDDMEADLIHFDDMHWGPEPDSCRCEACRRKFSNFLADRYPNDAAQRERFGHSYLDQIEPPQFDRFNQPWDIETIDDPVMQEWIDFRCATQAEAYEKLCAIIKEEDPNCAVDCNAIVRGIGSVNTPFYAGVWPPDGVAPGDLVWTESGNRAGVTDEGVLRSEIRTFKGARSINNVVFTYVDGKLAKGENRHGGFKHMDEALTEGDSRLPMAETMAYNPECLGMIGSPNGAFAEEERPLTEAVQSSTKEYVSFYRKHQEHFVNREPVTDVAVIRSYPSLAYDNYSAYQSTLLVEQTMIQSHIPFSIDFDFESLNDHAAVILPNAICLSDEDLERLYSFVDGGGGIVATEETGLYDERRRRRPTSGLVRTFDLGETFPDSITTVEIGEGTVTYLPTIEEAKTSFRPDTVSTDEPNYQFIESSHWRLPENSETIADAVETAADGLSMKIDGPQTVTAELATDKDKDRLYVSLVNYRSPQRIEDISIQIDHPIPADEVMLLTPDENNVQHLTAGTDGNELSFTVPELTTYCLLVIE